MWCVQMSSTSTWYLSPYSSSNPACHGACVASNGAVHSDWLGMRTRHASCAHRAPLQHVRRCLGKLEPGERPVPQQILHGRPWHGAASPAGKAAPRTGLERFSAGTVAAPSVAHQDEHPGLAVPRPLGCTCRWAQRPQRARMRQPAAAKLRRRRGWQEHKRWTAEQAACGGMLLPAADACSWGGSNSMLSQVCRSALLQAASSMAVLHTGEARQRDTAAPSHAGGSIAHPAAHSRMLPHRRQRRCQTASPCW